MDKKTNNWQTKKLGEVCDKISLNKIKIKQKDYLLEGKFPVIDQGQDIIGGYFNDENLVVPNEPPFIIFGDHTKVKKFIPFKFIAGADGVKVLKAKENVLPKFLFYLLHTIKIENKGYARHFQLLEKENFLFPEDLETQHAIVSKIEELFSELDKGITELKTAQQQLKTYRQSVLKSAFEGKLTNENVKDGELPDGWEIKKLLNEAYLITKGASPKWQGINYTNDSDQVLFITSENVRENFIDITNPKYLELSFNEKQKRSILKSGDILINIVGASIGRASLFNLEVNANINQAVCVVRLNEHIFNKYLSYFLNSNKALSYYNKNKVDVARANLSLADIGNIEFNCPSNLEEQHRIVQEIESRLSVADRMEQSIQESLQKAEALRQSILKKAFSGELV